MKPETKTPERAVLDDIALTALEKLDDPKECRTSKRRFAPRALLIVSLLVAIPACLLILTVFVFQTYQVDGPSMRPTLQTGDRLFVSKLPRTWARITGHQYIPKRGDIVIVDQSGLRGYGNSQDERQIVKRVIGLPGDRVVIRRSVITVYNRAHPGGFQPDTTLGYGRDRSIPPTPDNETMSVGPDQLFICGDNRTDSLDSRAFGPIRTDQVVGKLLVRLLPVSRLEKF